MRNRLNHILSSMAPKAGAKNGLTSSASSSSAPRCWLMKAEPESRLEKGIDVAFSVDIFAAAKVTTWDGVRNSEASKMMRQEMKIQDDVLFYHSNCKLPGIAGLAKIVKEGYPDHTAWDPSHPYFDAKTDKASPKWFMVDVQLLSKLPHLVPLALLQYLSSSDCSHSLPYLTQDQLDAISKMQLLNRGRLSVQRVERPAFDAIAMMGKQGGWQDWPGKWNIKARGKAPPSEGAAAEAKADEKAAASQKASGKKRDSKEEASQESEKRKSKRTRAG